jgi:microcin C transport system substrate-binding protein
MTGCGKPDPAQKKQNKAIQDAPVEIESGEVDPSASLEAMRGGRLNTWAGPFPKSLNYWLDPNTFSAKVSGLMFESLVELHSTRNEPVGSLAKSWSQSEDGLTFTFKLHPKAKWSDGKAITASDVIFYYETIMDPKNLTSVFRVDLSKINPPVALDEKTVQVVAKNQHWKNFWIAARLSALPQHVMKGKNFNKINFDFPVVSGPYTLKDVDKGRSITLERRSDWWGRALSYNQHKYNFDLLSFHASADRVKVLERLKRGDLDIYPIYTAKIWEKQTDFEAVKMNWVRRQRVFNDEPKGFQGIAFNMRRPPFDDLKVRTAFALLLNRQLMNEKYMYNQYFMLDSFYPDLYPSADNPDIPERVFNEEQARNLLKEAGYSVSDQGQQEKDGKPLEVTMMVFSPDTRHQSLFKEDLSKVGITLKLEQVDYSTVRKRLDQLDFDLHWQAWGASRLRDPETMWHSISANEKGTFNICGVVDPTIDQLIESQRTEMNLDRRNDILKKIDRRLADINPYALLWGSPAARILYWDRFGMPEKIFPRFGDPDDIVTYWWHDEEKAKRLKKSQNNEKSISPLPSEVHWD